MNEQRSSKDRTAVLTRTRRGGLPALAAQTAPPAGPVASVPSPALAMPLHSQMDEKEWLLAKTSSCQNACPRCGNFDVKVSCSGKLCPRLCPRCFLL